MKLSISLNDELLKKADEIAKKNHLTRSGLIAVSLSQYIMQQEILDAMKQISSSMSIIASKSVLDDEAKRHLRDIESIVNLLTSKGV